MESNIYIFKHLDIVERCKQGERKAQYELYKLYAHSMLNVCTRILNHSAEAEDVLQEAFVEAFTNLHSYKAQATFGAWLKQIVVNRALQHLRQRKLQTVSSELLEEEFDIEDHVSDYESDMALSVDKIKDVLKRLPDGYRLVLSLYLFEGYDHEEIASILNISEATSRTQYMRGKKKLLELIRG